MLGLIIILPLLGSLLFLNLDESDKNSNSIIKQIGLSTSLITLIFTLILFAKFNNNTTFYQFTTYLAPFGLLGVDGLSIYYVILTAFITPIALLSNWTDITYRLKYFVFAFLILETFQIAFFLVADLFMFYIYFESVLIPLFLIVGIYGASAARVRAAFLLFLYTLGGSLLMLLAILLISYSIGSTDFNYLSLFDLSIDAQGWAFFAFFLVFAKKSPLYYYNLNFLDMPAPLSWDRLYYSYNFENNNIVYKSNKNSKKKKFRSQTKNKANLNNSTANKKLEPWAITGLVDAESSFSIKIKPGSSTKSGR